MNPTPDDIDFLITGHNLGSVLRGELSIFVTPAEINDNMRPTDHDELLATGIYPLVNKYGEQFITKVLESAISEICVDALGVFCAHQCYYMEIVREDTGLSPLRIDRLQLPKILSERFLVQIPALHGLELRAGDLKLDRIYRLICSQMRILRNKYGIDWGISQLPT